MTPGEIASLIAAKEAAKFRLGDDCAADLRAYCQQANTAICRYADEHGVGSMGTTAAMLVFDREKIVLCNIGDSKIFRCDGARLEQISYDHVAIAAYGRKPPLMQNLGIPPEEMTIDPYVSEGPYQHGDRYLICSDGLTDMVSETEIGDVLMRYTLDEAAERLLQRALEEGGKDNITLILIDVSEQTL